MKVTMTQEEMVEALQEYLLKRSVRPSSLSLHVRPVGFWDPPGTKTVFWAEIKIETPTPRDR